MFKNRSLLINIILLAIIALLAVYVFVFNKNINFELKRPYYAVYLQTGDLYFGHLCKFFSKYTLTNVYLLQRDQSGNFSLQKFEQSAYQPEDKMILNKDNIVWFSKIKNESPLIPVLEGKQALIPTTVPFETPTAEPIPGQ
jgi:hypothetical protein